LLNVYVKGHYELSYEHADTHGNRSHYPNH